MWKIKFNYFQKLKTELQLRRELDRCWECNSILTINSDLSTNCPTCEQKFYQEPEKVQCKKKKPTT